MNPNMPKRVSQQIHARRRAIERLGLKLGPEDLERVAKFIQSGKAEFIERKSQRVSLHGVSLNGIDCVAVYDKFRKTVVTFLSREMVSKEHRRSRSELAAIRNGGAVAP